MARLGRARPNRSQVSRPVAAAPGTASATGSIDLGGTATGQAPATASGSLTLGGSATPQAAATSAGSISLGGAATGQAPGTASGGITLGGAAAAAGSAPARPDPSYPAPGLYPHPGFYPHGPGGTPLATLPTLYPDVYHAAIVSGGYTLTYTVDAFRQGTPVAGAQGMAPVGGSVTDTTKAGVRRTLRLDLAAEPGLYDLLSPIGTQLVVTARLRDPSRTGPNIAMGVFEIDSETLEEGGGKLSLTAPDKWARVQRARFTGPFSSIPGLRVADQIARLLRGALGANEPVNILATSTATVGALTWEKDRDKAIIDLASGIGAWVFFDRQGAATIADVPTLSRQADWTLTAGSETATIITMQRQRSRATAYNVVVVTSTASAGPAFATQVVWDSDPNSPTYAGSDPVNHPELAGPFGVVPYFFDTPLAMDEAGARAAGMTILAKTVGLASQISLTTGHNPAMDAYAVIDVLPPRERYDMARVLERHVADTVTHSLDLQQPLQVDGRSTRTDPYTSSA